MRLSWRHDRHHPAGPLRGRRGCGDHHAGRGRSRQAHAALSGGRVGLHLPRLPRPAPPDAQVRRAAGRRGVGLLQHAVEADLRHPGRRRRQGPGRADPPGGDVRRQREDLPQPALRPVQGPPPAAARRPRSPVPADPRGDARLRRAGHRAGGLRGRRRHRHLRPPGQPRRRRGGDRLLRQGPDAAGGRADLPARPRQAGEDLPRRGDREVRRAPGEGHRGPGAGRRQRGQRAGRAGHRHQDRRPAAHRIRRPRHAAGARARDQAAQAARDPDQLRRPGARLPPAGDPGRRRAGARPGVRLRGAGARSQGAVRLPGRDDLQDPGASRRRDGRPARARAAAPPAPPPRGGEDRPRDLCLHPGPGDAGRLDRARLRDRPDRLRHRDRRPVLLQRGALRHLPGHHAGRGGLHPARPLRRGRARPHRARALDPARTGGGRRAAEAAAGGPRAC